MSARSMSQTAAAKSSSTTSANSASSSPTSRPSTSTRSLKRSTSRFAGFLQYRAEDAYPEGWQDNQYANPDAVRIMTIHQAKGMQWPVVFVPALSEEPLPAQEAGGRNVWHLIPKAAVEGQARYRGHDRGRAPALLRGHDAQPEVPAPDLGARFPATNCSRERSEFWDDILVSKYVKRRAAGLLRRARACRRNPRNGVANVVFSFSDLKYFFECPYQFKLRILYGFNAPIHEALGYGKSLHDALAEVHARALRGDVCRRERRPATLSRRTCTRPMPTRRSGSSSSRRPRGCCATTWPTTQALFDKIEFSEKQIEISLGDGVTSLGASTSCAGSTPAKRRSST